MNRIAQIEKLILDAENEANEIPTSMWGFLSRQKPRQEAYLAIRELLFPEEFTGIFGSHSSTGSAKNE